MDTPLLSLGDAATFWSSLSWTDFRALPRKEETVVVIPAAGLADWGLGLPLDLEEVVLCSILKEASSSRGDLPLLVVPPLRFVTGPEPGCAFPVRFPVLCSQITEIVLSIRSSGFTKVVLLNSSPWNEEPCDAIARDLRIEQGVQMFCVSMSGLGLDLNPARSQSRWVVRDVYSMITGILPEPPPSSPRLAAAGALVFPQPSAGAAAFETASRQLASLLLEIFERPPLAAGGRIGAATLP